MWWSGLAPRSTIDTVQARILKADLHGAYISGAAGFFRAPGADLAAHGVMCCVTVVQCKCPSYVGLEGILLQETANTAVIVTRTHGFKSTSRRAPVRAVVDPPFS